MSAMGFFSGSKRVTLAVGILAIVAVVSSAALVQDTQDVRIGVAGKENTFNLEVAGSTDPNWNPAAGPWYSGGSEAVISPYGALPDIGPGESLTAQVAVRDVSTTLAGVIQLSVTDPDQGSSESGGPSFDLFSQMSLKVMKAGQTLSEGPIADAVEISVGRAEPGDIIVLDLIVSLPESLDNSFEGSRAGVQLQITGENR